MTYLHCPRCRLAVRCRASYLTFSNCPRCIARAAIATPMFTSPLDAHELRVAQRATDPEPRVPVAHRRRPIQPPPAISA
jgi:tRNA G26 N,N-dimethylase Trm1